MSYQTNVQKMPPQLFGREIGPRQKPLTLAEKLQALRTAQRENDREPADEFFRRDEITARFAYFD